MTISDSILACDVTLCQRSCQYLCCEPCAANGQSLHPHTETINSTSSSSTPAAAAAAAAVRTSFPLQHSLGCLICKNSGSRLKTCLQACCNILAGLKAEQGAPTGGLAGIQIIAWGARQAGVVDPGDEGVLRQGLSQNGTVASLRLHAQGHRLQAPQAQPAVKGAQDGALCILQP